MTVSLRCPNRHLVDIKRPNSTQEYSILSHIQGWLTIDYGHLDVVKLLNKLNKIFLSFLHLLVPLKAHQRPADILKSHKKSKGQVMVGHWSFKHVQDCVELAQQGLEVPLVNRIFYLNFFVKFFLTKFII